LLRLLSPLYAMYSTGTSFLVSLASSGQVPLLNLAHRHPPFSV
jgi:hypothetical protein